MQIVQKEKEKRMCFMDLNIGDVFILYKGGHGPSEVFQKIKSTFGGQINCINLTTSIVECLHHDTYVESCPDAVLYLYRLPKEL